MNFNFFKDELKKHAIGVLNNFQDIASAINSLDNSEGFKDVSKALQIIKFTDHPKDMVFLSEYFMNFFALYFKGGLFPQTFNLMNSVTTQESAVN